MGCVEGFGQFQFLWIDIDCCDVVGVQFVGVLQCQQVDGVGVDNNYVFIFIVLCQMKSVQVNGYWFDKCVIINWYLVWQVEQVGVFYYYIFGVVVFVV